MISFSSCYLIASLNFLLALPQAETAKPNIVFIMADDLGYGDLGCYGQKKILTPRIDSMAREGIRFTNYYAGCTVCAPSRCVLMTGKHMGHCRVRGNGGGLSQSLRPEDVTVAKLLQKSGYKTGLFGKWGLGDEGVAIVGSPIRQGFDEFYGYLNQHHAHNYWPTFLIKGESRVPLNNEVKPIGKDGGGVATKKVDYAPDLILQQSLDFISRNKKEPFFLFFSTTLPHANNEATRETGDGCEIPDLGIYKDKDWTRQNKAQAAMITYLDTQVGKILDHLKSQGLEQNTLVFFTSDNGPHKEGGNNPDFFDASGGLNGIKRSLHDGGIRVPMIARWPGKIPKEATSAHISYHGDFLATACDFAEIEIPNGLDGISMKPTLMGQNNSQKKHPYLYWEFYEGNGARAIRMNNWKGISKPFSQNQLEVYDLDKDAQEKNNLASVMPEITASLLKFMKEAHEDSKDWPKPGSQKK